VTSARSKVWDELMAIWRDARESGANPNWGQRRLAGRAEEFGLVTDYALAEVLVDIALDNRRGMHHSEIVVIQRIAEAAGYPVPDNQYILPDAALAGLVQASATDPVAWAACIRITDDAMTRGVPVPERLRDWVSAAIKGEAQRPDMRKSGMLAARDDAIRFAVRLVMESGAFRAPTHSANSKVPGTELEGAQARSACELVAQKFGQAGIGIAISYEEVARIWRNRNRQFDAIGTEEK